MMTKTPCPNCGQRPPVVDTLVRCWRCNHRLGDNLPRPWGPIKCPKCNAMVRSEPIPDVVESLWSANG